MQRLIEVSKLRRLAVKAGLGELVVFGKTLRIGPAELSDSKQMRLRRMYPGSKVVDATNSLAIPVLEGRDGNQPSDEEMLIWVRGILKAIFEIEDEAVEVPSDTEAK